MKNSFAHGGNIEEMSAAFGIKENRIIDFSSNVSPISLSDKVTKVIRSNIRNISKYPDKESTKLKAALGKHLNIGPKHIVVGNGSADIIYRAVYALKPGAGLIPSPSFGEYEKALLSAGAKIKSLILTERNKFKCLIEEVVEKAGEVDIVFISNPNNPTGMLMPGKDLERLAHKLQRKKTMLILDEAFIDLTEEHSLVDLAAKSNNLLVLRSMTKFYGLAGLRLGYAVGHIELIKRIQDAGQPWPVNIFAQFAGEAAIQDREFRSRSKRLLLNERDFMYQHLCRIRGLRLFQSWANFILVKIEGPLSSSRLQRCLIKRGLLIRDCSNFRGLNNKYIRVAVRSRKENLRLISELENLINEENKK